MSTTLIEIRVQTRRYKDGRDPKPYSVRVPKDISLGEFKSLLMRRSGKTTMTEKQFHPDFDLLSFVDDEKNVFTEARDRTEALFNLEKRYEREKEVKYQESHERLSSNFINLVILQLSIVIEVPSFQYSI